MMTNIIEDFDSENDNFSEEKDEEMAGFHEVDEVDDEDDEYEEDEEEEEEDDEDEEGDIVVKKIDLSDKIDDDYDDDMARNDW